MNCHICSSTKLVQFRQEVLNWVCPIKDTSKMFSAGEPLCKAGEHPHKARAFPIRSFLCALTMHTHKFTLTKCWFLLDEIQYNLYLYYIFFFVYYLYLHHCVKSLKKFGKASILPVDFVSTLLQHTWLLFSSQSFIGWFRHV